MSIYIYVYTRGYSCSFVRSARGSVRLYRDSVQEKYPDRDGPSWHCYQPSVACLEARV